MRRGASQEKHGLSRTWLYRRWVHMIERCHNPKSSSYHHYGAIGILVCEQWRASFVTFLSDMGHPPTQAHSIDRIDSAGNYEPSNCRWATRRQQGANTKRNCKLTYEGVTLNCSNWARCCGVVRQTLWGRIRKIGLEASLKQYGIDLEQAREMSRACGI